MAFPGGLRALNHPPFRSFFLAQLIALVGTWMQTVSQAWLVLQLTNSAFKLGLLARSSSGRSCCSRRWPA
jgi:Transmembrane secretion effector